MKNLSLKIAVFLFTLIAGKVALAQEKQFINSDSLPLFQKAIPKQLK